LIVFDQQYMIRFPYVSLDLLYLWKGKVKCRALPNSTFSPDLSAMAGNNTLHIGKANTSAFKFRLSMETLEYAEEPIHVLHVESYAVVRDGAGVLIILIFASDPDFSLRATT
jgi:hypothetical protein